METSLEGLLVTSHRGFDEVGGPTPEQLLYCAVIQRAVDDITGYIKSGVSYGKNAKRDASNAQLWIRSNDESPLSFVWMCSIVFGRYSSDLDQAVVARARKSLLTRLP